MQFSVNFFLFSLLFLIAGSNSGIRATCYLVKLIFICDIM